MAKPSWPMLANRTQGLRAVGGSLDLDAGRLVFQPNAFDKALGGEPAEVDLAQVVGVGVQPGRLHPLELFSGGLVARLRVLRADGSMELFGVNHLEDVVELLRAAVDEHTQ